MNRAAPSLTHYKAWTWAAHSQVLHPYLQVLLGRRWHVCATAARNPHTRSSTSMCQMATCAPYSSPTTSRTAMELFNTWTRSMTHPSLAVSSERWTSCGRSINSERPAANRYNLTEMCEKLLEAIADASRHFNEGAMREYDAAVGSRQFEYPAAHPLLFANQRNFGACVHYYDAQWKQAVKSKILTVTAPLRVEPTLLKDYQSLVGALLL
mmetsp:Transcript_14861/g.37039  ORF Transcript_14861/g.37039 Transcript_14861/m.37039 type:complete len:210 (-) Transcript_14861:665-1294(-)